MIRTNDPDWAIRETAFQAVEKLAIECNGRIPWGRISEGFTFNGDTIFFASKAPGIFKPRQMSSALSVISRVPRNGRKPWYPDQKPDSDFDDDTSLLAYSLAKNKHYSNEYLRKSYSMRSPIIYFRGIKEGIYEAVSPVWIERFDENLKRVLLAASDIMHPNRSSMEEYKFESTEVKEPSWKIVERKQRNHQSWFSKIVKSAYGYRCAFSGLPFDNLLVGAHIVPDAEGGLATVKNGICMSTLHHSAYDSFLIGIDPDYKIHVAPQVLDEQDGPVLQHIKDLDDQKLWVPTSTSEQPSKKYLEQRFSVFKKNSMI